MALDEKVRSYLAAIGRKGGRARMKDVTSKQQSSYSWARWARMSKKERSKAAARGWKTRRARARR